jgi:hypothetical protein
MVCFNASKAHREGSGEGEACSIVHFSFFIFHFFVNENYNMKNAQWKMIPVPSP